MSEPLDETATTVVKNLEGIETTLIMLFEQQQHLSTDLLSRTDERDISSRQLHLLFGCPSRSACRVVFGNPCERREYQGQ